jgi:Protein of unknown function (DUF3225)
MDEMTVAELSDDYEAALVRNDTGRLGQHFWQSSAVRRFGVADAQQGFEAIVRWRSSAPPVNPARRIVERTVCSLAPGVVAVDLSFDDGDPRSVGRQSQTWVRFPEGWRIARAHVSIVRTDT